MPPKRPRRCSDRNKDGIGIDIYVGIAGKPCVRFHFLYAGRIAETAKTESVGIYNVLVQLATETTGKNGVYTYMCT